MATNQKPPPPRSFSQEDKAARVLTRCGPYSLLQARELLETLQPPELAELVRLHDLLEDPHVQSVGQQLHALLGQIADRHEQERQAEQEHQAELRSPDGFRDLDEECDDGNEVDSDACNNDCEFQPTEQEPNDTLPNAVAYTDPLYGAISSQGDMDVFYVDVTEGSSLSIQTLDLGDGACARYELDSYIEVQDEAQTTVAYGDDTGIGFCAAVATDALEECELRRILDAFRDHAEPEDPRHRDDGFDDRRRSVIGEHLGDERAVDLDRIDREALQIAQRRVTRAEIVEREPHAELA